MYEQGDQQLDNWTDRILRKTRWEGVNDDLKCFFSYTRGHEVRTSEEKSRRLVNRG